MNIKFWQKDELFNRNIKLAEVKFYWQTRLLPTLLREG